MGRIIGLVVGIVLLPLFIFLVAKGAVMMFYGVAMVLPLLGYGLLVGGILWVINRIWKLPPWAS